MTKPLSILVADDDDGLRHLVANWLIAAGHAVVAVASATEALAAIRQRSVDLVITDVLMPDGDGLDLITDLRKSQPATRVLAISGGGRYMEGDTCVRMARGLGAHAALLKPFKWEQLLASMEEALNAPPRAA